MRTGFSTEHFLSERKHSNANYGVIGNSNGYFDIVSIAISPLNNDVTITLPKMLRYAA